MSQLHLTFSVFARSRDLEAMFQGIDDGPGRWVLAASSLDSPVWRDHRFLALYSRHELCMLILGLRRCVILPQAPRQAEAPSGMNLHSRYLAFCLRLSLSIFSFPNSSSALFGKQDFLEKFFTVFDHGWDTTERIVGGVGVFLLIQQWQVWDMRGTRIGNREYNKIALECL
ncbi:hypothetical protein BJX64DRAFT_115115 [Aspergillus heterothallicus]